MIGLAHRAYKMDILPDRGRLHPGKMSFHKDGKPQFWFCVLAEACRPCSNMGSGGIIETIWSRSSIGEPVRFLIHLFNLERPT